MMDFKKKNILSKIINNERYIQEFSEYISECIFKVRIMEDYSTKDIITEIRKNFIWKCTFIPITFSSETDLYINNEELEKLNKIDNLLVDLNSINIFDDECFDYKKCITVPSDFKITYDFGESDGYDVINFYKTRNYPCRFFRIKDTSKIVKIYYDSDIKISKGKTFISYDFKEFEAEEVFPDSKNRYNFYKNLEDFNNYNGYSSYISKEINNLVKENTKIRNEQLEYVNLEFKDVLKSYRHNELELEDLKKYVRDVLIPIVKKYDSDEYIYNIKVDVIPPELDQIGDDYNYLIKLEIGEK